VPELPELEALAEGLTTATAGREIGAVRAWQPAVLKTADPPLEALEGRTIRGVWRRGKLLGVDAGELVLLIHLMQGGRLGLAPAAEQRPSRTTALAVGLDAGEELRLREAATEHRASAHLLRAGEVEGHPQLAALGPEPIGLSPAAWRERLAARPARLHSALRDGRRVAGIGRAYTSDIMWAARLAPFARTDRLSDEEYERLAAAADLVLTQALERARGAITTNLPDRERRVTAVHGQHGEPCLRCGRRLERVSFEGYDLVYCPDCQTGGRVYADRRMSRFLR
jgi:formamidopyrimidine-DNA glycosylase